MPLILAIEPDRRQANQLKSMVRARLDAELVLADSAERALAALGDRVPDLILTSALLSPKDEIALDERLRSLDRSGSHVQTLTIPMLAAPQQAKSAGGMLSALRRGRSSKATHEGCDPGVFAEQCAEYLERARAERAHHAAGDEAPHGDPPQRLTKDQAKHTPAEAKLEEPEATLDPTLWAAPASDDGRADQPSAMDGVHDADLDLTTEFAVADQSVLEVEEQRPTFVPTAVDSAPEPVTAYGGNRFIRQATDENEDDADTYEIDLGELTDGDIATANPDPMGDHAWHAGNTGASDADHVQPYEIDVDELFVDAEKTPKQGAHSGAGGNGASIRSGSETGGRFGVSQLWPTPDDEFPDPRQVAFLDVSPPAVRAQAATSPDASSTQDAPPSSDPAESSRPGWLDMVESLRSDVQLLQTEWASTTFTSPTTVSPIADSGDSAAQLRETPVAPPVVASTPEKSRTKAKKREPKKKRPAKDEWGFFDPEQCGFAALLTKLEEITDDEFADSDS